MSIKFQSKVEDGILIVTASGRDDNVNQVIEYGRSIIQLTIEKGVMCVLCDERNLEYTIDGLDSYDSARKIAEEAPKLARVAIICRPESLKKGKLWEIVAVNHGLQVRVDTDISRARAWLDQQTESKR